MFHIPFTHFGRCQDDIFCLNVATFFLMMHNVSLGELSISPAECNVCF